MNPFLLRYILQFWNENVQFFLMNQVWIFLTFKVVFTKTKIFATSVNIASFVTKNTEC